MAQPPDPSKPRIFYGWVIVLGAALVGLSSAAMAGLNFGFFITPMSEELGIGESFFGWAFTARMLAFAASGFVIGRALDRYGPRIPLVVAGVLATIALIGFSRITNGLHLIGLFMLTGAIGVQGAGASLYINVPVSKWFRRKRGRAMSMAFLGIPTGIFIFPILTQFLIEKVGWQSAWLVLAAFSGPLLIFVGLFIMRREPADYGLLPDGDLPGMDGRTANAQPGESAPEVAEEVSWTRAQALRSPTFWRLALVLGLLQFSTSSVGLFRVPFFVERGIDPNLLGFAYQGEAIASVIAGIPVGFALDRFQARYLASATIIPRVLSILVTIYTANALHAAAATTLNGLAAASFVVVQGAIWPSYFGSRHIGSIRGASMAITLPFAALGAPVAGMVREYTGSYLPVWWASIGLLIVGSVVMLFTPKPRPPVPQEQVGRLS